MCIPCQTASVGGVQAVVGGGSAGSAFEGTRRDNPSQQSLDALKQIYGYMAFNNKFGILTNWRSALFLRCAETSDRKTLKYDLSN